MMNFENPSDADYNRTSLYMHRYINFFLMNYITG